MKMDIVKVNANLKTPTYATDGSGALDLYANITETVNILPGEGMMIGTGIKCNIPDDHLGLLVPRSGKGSQGLNLKNTIGLIDSDYHGEVMANVVNRHPKDNLTIAPGERFIQFAIVPVIQVDINVVDELPDSVRGEGGFGSTGKH